MTRFVPVAMHLMLATSACGSGSETAEPHNGPAAEVGCNSDDECPERTVCRSVTQSGGRLVGECRDAVVCETHNDCLKIRSGLAECRLRGTWVRAADDSDGSASFECDHSFATRATCEPKRCECDFDCGHGSVACRYSPLGGGPMDCGASKLCGVHREECRSQGDCEFSGFQPGLVCRADDCGGGARLCRFSRAP